MLLKAILVNVETKNIFFKKFGDFEIEPSLMGSFLSGLSIFARDISQEQIKEIIMGNNRIYYHLVDESHEFNITIIAKKEAKEEPAEKLQEVEKEPEEDFQVGEDLLVDVKTDLARLLELMHYPSAVSVSSDREYVTALIQGQYVDEIVDQNGKILDSLQYLLRKMIGKKYSEKAIISLDAGDFRATRSEELKQLGLDLAEEVKKNGKTRSIPSLNPSERRVVHLALQDDKEVRSRSVGEGLFKKVLIYRPGTKSRKGPAKRRKGARSKKSQ